MSLKLTPELLAAAYTFLRTTPPFCRWKLPPAETVKFRVTQHKDLHGQAWGGGTEPFCIDISAGTVGHTASLVITMAHEMVHIHCFMQGEKAEHGARFKRCAATVCKYHGFDGKVF